MEDRAPPYPVFILCRTVPELDRVRVHEMVGAMLGAVDPLGEDSDLLAFVLKDHLPEGSPIPIPPQVLFTVTPEPPDEDKLLRELREQTWGWPASDGPLEAAAVLGVFPLFLGPLDPIQRIEVVQGAVLAALELVDPVAIAWVPAQKLIDPEEFKHVVRTGDTPDRIRLALNVRLFNVGNGGPDETIMDTRGLDALGARDLQFHFSEYEPGPVAGWLYSIAAYVAQNPEAIDAGQTVGGLSAGDAWVCTYQEALAGPERVVMDIDCGPPFNARPAQTSDERSEPEPAKPWWQFWN